MKTPARSRPARWLATLLGSLTFLGGAVSAGASEDAPPSRPVLRPETGIAPPKRIPDALPAGEQPAGTPVAITMVPKAVRRAVVADAARRFGVDESAVVLVRAEQVTWSDGSLGCPEPGVYYTQNLVPGFVVVAKTATDEIAYHTDTKGQARSCAAGRPKINRKWPERTPAQTPAPPAPDR